MHRQLLLVFSIATLSACGGTSVVDESSSSSVMSISSSSQPVAVSSPSAIPSSASGMSSSIASSSLATSSASSSVVMSSSSASAVTVIISSSSPSSVASSSRQSSSSSAPMMGCEGEVMLGKDNYDSSCKVCHGDVPTNGDTVWGSRVINLFDDDNNGYKKRGGDGGQQLKLPIDEFIANWMPDKANAVGKNIGENITAYLSHTVGKPWCPGDNWPPTPSTPKDDQPKDNEPDNKKSELSFFITSNTPSGSGKLGGLNGADAHCQKLAEAVGAGDRNWKALLSTSNPKVNARSRIGQGPWKNAKGVTVARNINHLFGQSNNLSLENSLDEKGNRISISDPNKHDIITGSNAQGRSLEGLDCNNWTSNSSNHKARVGHHNKFGTGKNGDQMSWLSAHDSRGCSAQNFKGSGGAGLYYCFAAD